jgi:precorrin-6B methylase 2
MRALNTDGDTAGDFDAVWSQVEPVGGWLTRDQARALHDAVLALVPGATVVEIGSHQGRSTLARALARPDVTVVAVDPFEAGGMFGGPATRAVFEANLERAGVRGRVEHVAERSGAARSRWRRPVDLVFVDGKHDVVSTLGDLRWADRLPSGGLLLVHDSFGSLGVTLALLLRVGPSRRLRYVGRVGSLATFERRRPTSADRLALLRPLPWFGRNLVVKGLLRFRLRGVARRLWHHDRADPY